MWTRFNSWSIQGLMSRIRWQKDSIQVRASYFKWTYWCIPKAFFLVHNVIVENVTYVSEDVLYRTNGNSPSWCYEYFNIRMAWINCYKTSLKSMLDSWCELRHLVWVTWNGTNVTKLAFYTSGDIMLKLRRFWYSMNTAHRTKRLWLIWKSTNSCIRWAVAPPFPNPFFHFHNVVIENICGILYTWRNSDTRN